MYVLIKYATSAADAKLKLLSINIKYEKMKWANILNLMLLRILPTVKMICKNGPILKRSAICLQSFISNHFAQTYLGHTFAAMLHQQNCGLYINGTVSVRHLSNIVSFTQNRHKNIYPTGSIILLSIMRVIKYMLMLC